MYYRLSQDVKVLFLRFFQKLFTLYKEGKISFVDGRNNIKFTVPPECKDADTYDFKSYPTVMVALSPGTFREASFNRVRGVNTTGNAQIVYGAIVDVSATFTVVAITENDRNSLADLICVYLAKRETRHAFETKYGIRLGMPTFSGDSTEVDTQLNTKRFFTTITVPMSLDVEDTDTILDTFGNPGVVLEDVLSYIGDPNGDGELTDFQDNSLPL